MGKGSESGKLIGPLVSKIAMVQHHFLALYGVTGSLFLSLEELGLQLLSV